MNGTIELTLRKNMQLSSPVAETPSDILATGFTETVDDAFQATLHSMVDVLSKLTGITETEAYCLCSLAVTFRITQVVNSPQKGVHGLFPRPLLLPQMHSF
jgi:acetamidase/formamidase